MPQSLLHAQGNEVRCSAISRACRRRHPFGVPRPTRHRWRPGLQTPAPGDPPVTRRNVRCYPAAPTRRFIVGTWTTALPIQQASADAGSQSCEIAALRSHIGYRVERLPLGRQAAKLPAATEEHRSKSRVRDLCPGASGRPRP
jgi:hypothetical protein